MPPRSIVNQGLYLQKEVTPGTPVTNAMQRYLGIRLMPGYGVETQEFKASGYKVNTTTQILSEQGTHTVEAIQDYNALLPILASVLNYDGVAPGADPLSFEHTFSLTADAADTLTTFTGIWGDSDQALQLAFLVFNSLTLGIQRGALSVGTSAISYEPTTGAAIPGVGVSEIDSVPLPARGYDLFIDADWASLGTTKAAQAYDFNLTIGDKRTPVNVIDSTITSYAALLENTDIEFSGNVRAGFDADAITLIADYKAGTPKFIRVSNEGPAIGTLDNYLLEVDVSTVIQSPGEIGSAPNSPAVSIPFNFIMKPDKTTGNVLTIRLVNTVASL